MKFLECVREDKIEQLLETKRFVNRRLAENFLSYVIGHLNIDIDSSIAAWLDDDAHWLNSERIHD